MFELPVRQEEAKHEKSMGVEHFSLKNGKSEGPKQEQDIPEQQTHCCWTLESGGK